MQLYGVTQAKWEAMMAEQQGMCACGETLGAEGIRCDEQPVLDHDHETGAARGILHRKCNTYLGGYELAYEWAKTYLEKARC